MLKTITIPCGQIQGTDCQWPGVTAYKGIRYATADRWAYPVEVTSWDGVYDASEYGNCSYQPRAFYDEETVIEKVFYYYEFRKGASYTYSEDCLFLNVWVPEDATPDSKLPVLFYIHGGGYTGGCGHEKHFDGPVWASKGVVAVTCNYRLGPMGFMCLPGLKERDGHTGNYGLYDQMMAMQWVQHNIAAFGGDPENVTVMGQSAGAMSTMQHCISPLTHGLFNKAVMSSGGGAHKLMDSAQTYEDRYEFWERVVAETGCKNLDEFLTVDVEKVFQAWQKLKKENMKYAMVASPCVDGELLTKSPLTAMNDGDVKDIPYMLGATSQDMMPFFIFPMSKDFCDKQKKAYCWFFDRQLPGDKNGAWHSSDLWYWFGTLKNGWRPFEEKDYTLSDAMSSYLCNFVKTGDPNGAGLVEWKQAKAGQKEVIRLGEGNIRMEKVCKAKLLWTTLTNKNVGE